MGRTEPSVGRPPAGFRRDARAKRAKATINKVMPPLLAAHPRARKGIEASEMIVDPPPSSMPSAQASRGKTQQRIRPDSAAGESNGTDESKGHPRISLCVADTLEAAYSLLLVPDHPQSPTDQQQQQQRRRRDLSNTTARVGVLNMASPLSAGGGFLNGASSQEESLCMRSTLLPSLRDEFYRLPELGVVFTPDVLVFPEEEEVLPKRDRWFVDVASAAMIRIPEIDVDAESGFARYASAADRELAVRKVRAVLRVFAAKGVRRVVLGAWGCGAYGNPVGEIAKAWRKKKKESDSDSWECFEHVVFAIKDQGMAQAFATAFGEEFLEVHDPSEGEGSVGSKDEEYAEEEEDASVKELRNKIRELELRTEQARTPQLKAGLSSVLAGLRSQLPDSDGICSRKELVGSKGDRDHESTSEEDDESAERESGCDDETRSGHDEES
ncbi:hypothetical protein F4811DRAFT_564467 [Daldinia bambusicola]|nr:hypothetical protein F4811DRAFT_564467 [Daldinia bambusicola]